MTASSVMGKARDYLRATLAATAAWQSLCNASSEAAALERIHRNGLPRPDNKDTHTRQELEALRPFAIVYTSPQQGFSRAGESVSADGNDYDASGQLVVELYRTCADMEGDDPSGPAMAEWEDLVGLLIDQIAALAGQAGYLDAQRISLMAGPSFAARDRVESQGLYQWATLLVEW